MPALFFFTLKFTLAISCAQALGSAVCNTTTRDECGLIVTANGRRRFPASPQLSSSPTQMTPHCQANESCISLPRTVGPPVPEWAGRQYLSHPVCHNNTRRCDTHPPATINREHLVATPVVDDLTNYLVTHDWPSGLDRYCRSLALGDVSGDGWLDVVVGTANIEDNGVLLNDQSGGFILGQTLPGNRYNTFAVALGDVDGNGALDIVFGNSDGPNLLLLNNGSGVYEQAVELPGGNFQTMSVAMTDVNLDGWLDIVIGNRNSMILLLLNNGTGGFHLAAEHGLSSGSVMSLQLGDMDGDGLEDVVVRASLSEISLLRNSGSGFLPSVKIADVSSSTGPMALGDVDGDGFLDVVVGHYLTGDQVLRGDGAGGVAEVIELDGTGTVKTNCVALGDVDGDGRLDLLVGNWGSDNLFLNDGNGGFGKGLVVPGGTLENTFAIGFGDVDRDGRLDWVAGRWVGCTTYRNFPAVYDFEEEVPLSTARGGTQWIAVGDVNKDGFSDLALAKGTDGNSDQVSEVLLNNGAGAFHEAALLPSGQLHATGIALGDVNGDGWDDLIVGTGYYSHNKHTLLLLNNGQGSFEEVITLPGGTYDTQCIALGDVDGDGSLDIVVANNGEPNELLLNNGTGGFPSAFQLPGATTGLQGMPVANAVAIADLNGDGWQDIIFGNAYYHDPDYHLLNLGNGSFEALAVEGRTQAMAVGDVNGDGWVDVVKGTSGSNRLLLNRGAGSFHPIFDSIDLPGGSSSTHSVVLGDIDGDGWLDIVFGNDGAENVVLRNSGGGIFEQTSVLPGGASSTIALGLIDMDRDGRLDIVFGNANEGVGVLRGTPCLVGGALLHGASWCFRCPEHMGRTGSACVECLPDHIQQQGAGEVCASESCPLAARALGADSCVRCDANNGSFYDSAVTRSEADPSSWAAPRCLPCAPGSFADGSLPAIDACFQCSAGKYQDGVGSSACISCAPGTFQAERGASGCEACAAGGFCAAVDTCGGGFVPCRPGTFNPNSSSSTEADCQLCPVGSYSPTTQAVSSDACRPCRPGTFRAEAGMPDCTPCAAGSYQVEHGATSCNRCPGGHYCPEGTSAPRPCPAGRRVNASIEVMKRVEDCIVCSAGTFCPTGSAEETACAPGTFGPDVGESSCPRCPAGTYQDAHGATSCRQCDAGYYCAYGAAAPLPCPVGRRTNASLEVMKRVEDCIVCSAGTFCPTGSAEETACAPGTFGPDQGMGTCLLCELGTFSSGGATVCSDCAKGTYADKRGQGECTLCPHPLSSGTGSSECSVCQAGFYLRDSRSAKTAMMMKNPGEHCLRCSLHAECPHNTTLETLVVPRDYWRDSLSNPRLFLCRNQTGSSSCRGSSGSHSANTSLLAGDHRYCEDGHRGPRCAVCTEAHHFFSDVTERCEPCAPGSRLGVLVSVVVGVAIVVGVGFFAARHIDACRRAARRLEMVSSTLHLQAKFKVLVSFFQVFNTIGSVYGVRLHPRFTSWLSTLAVVNFDPLHFIIPASCMGSMHRRLVVSAVAPLIALLVVVLGIVGHVLVTKDSSKQGSRADVILERSLYACIFIFYLVLPSVSSSIFLSRQCESFGADVHGESRSYLVADLTVRCGGPEYTRLGNFFWAAFVLWTVLVPLGFLMLLLSVRQSVRSQRITRLAEACRFLWRDYDASLLYWEVIDTIRKLSLTSFILFLDPEYGSSRLLRLVIAAIISTIYLAILMLVRPFKRTEDRSLACTANLLLACCFISGIPIKLCEGGQWADSCDAFLGLSGSYTANVFIIIVTIVMLMVTLLTIVGKAATVVSAPTIRLVSSGQEPLLDLPESCSFHCFFSHVWSTGQDQTHTIVRQLYLLLPELKIWLDVDCLENVGKLEAEVESAAVFIIFLSKGYFQSPNCQRELSAVLKTGKPIVAVRETDTTKGGLPLDELKEECRAWLTEAQNQKWEKDGPPWSAEDVITRIFEPEPVAWVRVHDYQLESLKTLSHRLLGHLPFYQNKSRELSQGLVVRGELGPVGFTSPVRLLYCRANVGAQELAAELQTESHVEEGSIGLQLGEADAVLSEALKGEGRGLQPGEQASLLSPSRKWSTASLRSVGLGEGATPPDAGGRLVLLLYLNLYTFDADGTVAELVIRALDAAIPIALVQEQDPSRGGCAFRRFYDLTPRVLLSQYKLFDTLADPLYSTPEHRSISLRNILRHGMQARPVASRSRSALWRFVAECCGSTRQPSRQVADEPAPPAVDDVERDGGRGAASMSDAAAPAALTSEPVLGGRDKSAPRLPPVKTAWRSFRKPSEAQSLQNRECA